MLHKIQQVRDLLISDVFSTSANTPSEKKDKALLLDVARQKGFTFDKKTKAFIAAAAEAAQAGTGA